MAHFYVSSSGGAGEATRTGTKSSGIRAHVRGRGAGVKVYGHVTVAGEDEFHVYSTGGSSGGGRERMIGVLLADGRFIPEGAHESLDS